jgi:hypothetical protein
MMLNLNKRVCFIAASKNQKKSENSEMIPAVYRYLEIKILNHYYPVCQ